MNKRMSKKSQLEQPAHLHSANTSLHVLLRVLILLLLLLVVPTVYFGTQYLSLTSTSAHHDLTVAAPVATVPAMLWDPQVNPLGIPPGQAPNLPSPRLTVDTVQRKGYGGKGDAAHLGGFSEIDPGGIAPGLFKHMIEVLGVHSFLDIGCGRGFSTSWFAFHGVDVLCAEGSHDAIERSVLPDPATQVVEHDFSRGPWWPAKTYDAAWSVEFLEHVGTEYHFNYVSALRKAALIFVTASKGGGWHHVEVHSNDWWIRKYESYGFKYDEALSTEAKAIARTTKKTFKGPHEMYLDGFYVRVTLMVFINPVVAALPEHAHLFPELGCFTKNKGARKCQQKLGESVPHARMSPLNLTDAMDQQWVEWLEPQVKRPKSF